MSPTAKAAAILGGVAVAAVFIPWWAAGALGLGVVGAVVVDAFLSRRAPNVEREVPRVLARGVAASLRLTAEPASGTVRLRQASPPDLEIEPKEADEILATTIVARRRGEHVLPAPAARVVGPLGLAAWYRRPGVDLAISVYPDLPAARRLATAVRRGQFRLDGRARGPLGLGTEFESIRDYEPDDDIRQVNWRATQRLGRPMSNQFRVERDRDVICLVDCGRLMAAPLGDRTRLDAAVDAAVAVAAVADQLADRCGTIAFDRGVSRQTAPARRGGRHVVQALYDVEPVPVDSDYERAFATLGEAKRAWVLVLTDILEQSAARPLLDALPMLVRRHAVAVASATDVDLEQLLTQPPRERLDVYRTVVAFDVRRAQAGVVAAIARRGADVIQAPPDSLAEACVRSYLRAKSRAIA